MHLYNKWLPPPVAQHVPDEQRRFSALVAHIGKEWQPDDPFGRLESCQWIPTINMFLKVKSELAISDLEALTSMGLKLVLSSCDNLYIQQRWSLCLTRILTKYRHKLSLRINWRPLYELLLNVHFERRHSYEGYALKRNHLNTIVYLIRCCRRFFPSGSVTEIWHEFRPALEDISHNSALEAMGFLSLLLPSPNTKREEATFFTSEWVKECLELWDALPHSNYWSLQWASLLKRCIKHQADAPLDWNPFMRTLYMHYLRTFEVPVGKSGAWPPVYRRIPREVQAAFYTCGSPSISVVVARSIVYLLAPGGDGQGHLESLVDLLEQYYHPSNGGSWTVSLERFLRYIVIYFMKRVTDEQLKRAQSGSTDGRTHFLGSAERVAFVKVIMRLIERGQYSKNISLAATAANAASKLSYLEPLIVLPQIISCFQAAMDTITATHQLQSSLTSLSLIARTVLLASSKEADSIESNWEIDSPGSDPNTSVLDCRATLMEAMFNTLPGLDANDPPKTLATLQLYCAVLSSVSMIEPVGRSGVFPIDWPMWVEMFLSRVFVLLLNLEPPSFESEADSGFLMDTGSHYSSVLSLIFEKSTPSIFNQALRMVSKFVRSNILPGAVCEIGQLCSAAVYASPSLALQQLVEPIMNSIISSLVEAPSTGFSASASIKSSHDFKVGLSPALETTVKYQIQVLAQAIAVGGAALPPYKELLKEVIAAAFDAPSSKVNEAGNILLSSVIRSMVQYYTLDLAKSTPATDDGFEEWFASKGRNSPEDKSAPLWHIPSHDEIAFAEELLDLHLQGSLNDLRVITKEATLVKPSGQEKERLRVVLLRLDGTLQGLGSCLPDFDMPTGMNLQTSGVVMELFTVVGAAGTQIGSAALREEIADTLHITCEYMLKDRSDDTILLKLLVRLLGTVADYGTTDYSYWSQSMAVWESDCRTLTEPHSNFITCPDPQRRRRPWWMLVERVNLQNEFRATQAGYRCYSKGPVPERVTLLLKDLLKLSLHSYSAVRLNAGSKVGRILKRYPVLTKDSIPLLTASLQDPQAKEETVLGACTVLTYKPVMRYLMQDWNALATFFLALLRSSHHETVKAQNAISELFLVFNILYGGVPFNSYTNAGTSLDDMSYSKMITLIQDQVVPGGSVTVHWRYNLMANGMLLFLVLPPPSDAQSFYAGTVTKSRENMAGGFIANLQSELPALRPLSVIALLFLLQATTAMGSGPSIVRSPWLQSKSKVNVVISLKTALVSIMQSQGFGNKVISNLAVDHHYFEGQNTYNPQRISDVGLTALMPTYMRDWPHTRTTDSGLEGEAFSSTFARLFQYLVQECGSIAVETLRGPLEEACNELEERGKQCIAAEIMAGLLHSDDESVAEAWDDLFGPLLRKALLHSTMESAAEWAACVRFAVGGEGGNGRHVPMLRYKILDCLAEPLPEEASTSLLTKRLTLLRAAVNELLPKARVDKEITFQISLLTEVMPYMSHRAPQVRQGVGKIMCMLCANLQQLADFEEDTSSNREARKMLVEWKATVVNGAVSAVTKIRDEGGQHLGETSTSIESYSAESKEAVRWMETVLYFMMATVRSGNATVLLDVLIELLHPLLSLQETWHKELAKKAKTAVMLMRWQPFGSGHLSAAVSSVLTATADNNWHTRVAAVKFMQPLIYRHTYVMVRSDLEGLWGRVRELLSDTQLEVREHAATTLAGMMKGEGGMHAAAFREDMVKTSKAQLLVKAKRKYTSGQSIATAHGLVLGLAACVLSVPYDMPRWLPEMVIALARFIHEPWPIRATVTKTIGEFRRTHIDTWDSQKAAFSEDQLEVLSDLTSSASYFA